METTKNFQVTVKIDGMACSMCEAHINEAIRKAYPAAKKVSSSHSKGEARFLLPTDIDREELCRVISETGYDFVSCESKPYEKRGLFGRG